MPMMRGTRVVLLLGAVGAKAGDVGKVSSRKKNGWLRVTCCRMGDIRKTVSVRNTKSNVIRYDEWLKQHTIKLKVKPEVVCTYSTRETREADSMSDEDEFDIVDPPDDAYGDLTEEQQQSVRRLIGEFKKINKSSASAAL